MTVAAVYEILKKGFSRRTCTYLNFTVFPLSVEGFACADCTLYKCEELRIPIMPDSCIVSVIFFSSIAWQRGDFKVAIPECVKCVSQLCRCGATDGLEGVLSTAA